MKARGPRVVAFTMIWVQIAFVTWSCAHGFFFNDDYAIQAHAATAPWADLHLLLQPWGGHFMPGAFLLAQVPAKTADFNYAYYVLALSLMQAAVAWGLYLVLVRLFGVRWRILIPLAVYLLSIPVLQATIWWSSAINSLPYLGAILASTYFTVGYVRTRRSLSLVGALGSYAAGLLFYEKALLLAGFLALLLVVLSPERSPFRAVRWAIRRGWALLLGLAAVTGVWAIAYTLNQTADVASAPLTDLVGYQMLTGLAGTWLASLVGGPWDWAPMGPGYATTITPDTTAVLLALAAAIAVLWLARCGPRARRALLAIALYGVGAVIVINIGRQGLLGFTAGLPRYYADVTMVAALGLGFILMHLERDPWPETLREPRLPSLDRPGNVVLVLALLNVWAASYVASALTLTDFLTGNPSRSFVMNATAGLTRLGPDEQMLDDVVPPIMAAGFTTDTNLRSFVFSPLRGGPTFARAVAQPWTFASDGKVTLGSMKGPASPVGPVANCGWNVSGAGIDIPLATPLMPWAHVIRIQYLSPVDTAGFAQLDGGAAQEVTFEKGLHDIYVWAEGGGDHVRLGLYGDAGEVCVDRVTVGELVAGPATGSP